MEDGNVEPCSRCGSMVYLEGNCLICGYPDPAANPAIRLRPQPHKVEDGNVIARLKAENSRLRRKYADSAVAYMKLLDKPHSIDCGQDDCPCVRRGIDLMAKSMRQR